jgi:hypothetical protein
MDLETALSFVGFQKICDLGLAEAFGGGAGGVSLVVLEEGVGAGLEEDFG